MKTELNEAVINVKLELKNFLLNLDEQTRYKLVAIAKEETEILNSAKRAYSLISDRPAEGLKNVGYLDEIITSKSTEEILECEYLRISFGFCPRVLFHSKKLGLSREQEKVMLKAIRLIERLYIHISKLVTEPSYEVTLYCLDNYSQDSGFSFFAYYESSSKLHSTSENIVASGLKIGDYKNIKKVKELLENAGKGINPVEYIVRELGVKRSTAQHLFEQSSHSQIKVSYDELIENNETVNTAAEEVSFEDAMIREIDNEVAAKRNGIISNMDTAILEIEKIFDPKIMQYIYAGGEKSQLEVAEEMGISPQNLTKKLKSTAKKISRLRISENA